MSVHICRRREVKGLLLAASISAAHLPVAWLSLRHGALRACEGSATCPSLCTPEHQASPQEGARHIWPGGTKSAGKPARTPGHRASLQSACQPEPGGRLLELAPPAQAARPSY